MTIKTWQERMAADVQGLDKCVHMGNEIAELRAELEQARKDAGRFQYLLEHHSYSYGMHIDSPAEHGIEYQWQQATYEERDFGIRASIDAAIAKEQV